MAQAIVLHNYMRDQEKKQMGWGKGEENRTG